MGAFPGGCDSRLGEDRRSLAEVVITTAALAVVVVVVVALLAVGRHRKR